MGDERHVQDIFSNLSNDNKKEKLKDKLCKILDSPDWCMVTLFSMTIIETNVWWKRSFGGITSYWQLWQNIGIQNLKCCAIFHRPIARCWHGNITHECQFILVLHNDIASLKHHTAPLALLQCIFQIFPQQPLMFFSNHYITTISVHRAFNWCMLLGNPSIATARFV